MCFVGGTPLLPSREVSLKSGKMAAKEMKPADQILLDAKRDRENLRQTIRRADQQSVAQVLGVLDLFGEFFPSLLVSIDGVHRLSAFWIYYNDSVHLARRAWTETTCFYYRIGHTLLRNALESLIRGAFWEGMAHKQFREEAQVVRRTGQKIGTETRTLLDWFTDVFKHRADAEDTLEQVSASVFDRTSALFSERSLSKVAPNFKKMLEQVAAWEMLKPMEAPVPAIHDHLYWELSKDAHMIPDKTLMGRRFIEETKGAFPLIAFRPEELDSFCGALSCVADVGMVLSLNLVRSIGDLDDSFYAKLADFDARVSTLLPDLYMAKLLRQFGTQP
jgi:hypothetical protein